MSSQGYFMKLMCYFWEVTMSLFSLTIPAEPLVRQVKRTRIKREDFHILKVIGRGTFSEVG